MITHCAALVALIGLLLAHTSCKEELVVDPPKPPKIDYVDPLLGTVDTEVTIVGENFEAVATENEVTINGKSVDILAGNESEIIVKVPRDVGSGEVVVTTRVARARGPLFTYYNSVVITSVEPLSGSFNTLVIVRGENFEADKDMNKLKVNGKEIPLLSASSTEIKFTIPRATGTGPIIISTQYSAFEGPTFNYELVPVVYTIAGDGEEGFVNGVGEGARFSNPDGLALDGDDNIYVCDRGNHRLRKIDGAGNVTTFAGTGDQGVADGDLLAAKFNLPSGIAIAGGDFFITDSGNGNIRKITSTGQVLTIAGDGVPGFTDGIGSIARFGAPRGIVVDNSGNLLIADFGNSVIRRVTPAGVVTTLAGDGIPGLMDGTGTVARFNFPVGIMWKDANTLLIADHLNNRIRSMMLDGTTTTFTGTGNGFTDGDIASARFSGITSMAFDLNGNLLIADALNYRVRVLGANGMVTTIAGDGTKGFRNGLGVEAEFEFINAIVVNSKGEIIISDGGNHAIRRIVFE